MGTCFKKFKNCWKKHTMGMWAQLAQHKPSFSALRDPEWFEKTIFTPLMCELTQKFWLQKGCKFLFFLPLLFIYLFIFLINFESQHFWRLGHTSCLEPFYVLFFLFFSSCFHYILKQVSISWLEKCCKVVLLWISRNVLWTTKHFSFPVGLGMTMAVFIFGWTYPLIGPT